MVSLSAEVPVVAIIGAGFGGLNAALALRQRRVQVILIDRRNYHLFQPLLYQVATAGLSPADIAYPVRAVFQRQRNLRFLLAEVSRVELENRRLITSAGVVDYDYLIVSAGSESNTFGLDSVAANGFELKDLNDAEAIRNHILSMFEQSLLETDLARQAAQRTFVVVGGGPTGVECAGALSELIRLVLRKDYPEMDISTVRVVVLEMRDSLLPGFPAELSRVAGERLAQKHVEVCFHVRVTDFDGYQVALQDGSAISARTLIWAAGVRAAGLVDRLGVQQARQGRVVVQPTLQLEGHPEVYVIGDAAYFEAEGQPLPMMAPVAIQQARLATGNILRQVAGQPPLAFVYRDPGSLATIGRGEAVARLGRLQFHGFLAWWIWLAVHIFWLIGFRNRLLVLINWAWSYLLYDSAVRLILPAKKAKDDQ